MLSRPGRGEAGSEPHWMGPDRAGLGRSGPVGAGRGAGTCANPKWLGTQESQVYLSYR